MNENLKAIVESYKPSSDTIQLVRDTPIVLLVGVAGAGKDTIKHRLLETGNYHHIVSHTTRAPRSNREVMEQDGVEYHFIDPGTAQSMLERGEFVEAKFVHGETVYGTSAAEIAKAKGDGRVALTDIDVQGVAEYKAISANVIAVFVLPPSFEEWQRRLLARYVGAEGAKGDIQNRMHTAIAELREALARPYYHFVINDNLDTAVEAVDSVAHHHDEFTTIDDAFWSKAEQLLADLETHVKTTV